MYSDQQKVNQSYDLTYTQIIQKILLDYLKISNNITIICIKNKVKHHKIEYVSS
jgi:hypothetical protein